jgi:hypothetical protein
MTRRGLKAFSTMTVTLTADFSSFGIAMDQASQSMKNLARVWTTTAFKPKFGRWHKLGFHNKCSPIICKKAADLCNQAESDLRMEEYLKEQENGRYYTEYDAGIKLDPYLKDSQEYWDS